MNTPNKLFVAIAVSKPGGQLEPLPGVVVSARKMVDWASINGYRTLCIDDSNGEVVSVELLRERLRDAIESIRSTTELSRLIIYFAGHGAAHSVGDYYWILTEWERRATEAIKVSALQRMLEYYGPKQVTIIGDACQEFSSRFIDVIGSAVLDRPDETPQFYELDQFFAVDVGKQAFMVRETADSEAFCIFTKVILKALRGSAEINAFETREDWLLVTSQSLARHLQNAVEVEAGKYGVRMIPRSRPGYFTDCIYARFQFYKEPVTKEMGYRGKDVRYLDKEFGNVGGKVLNAAGEVGNEIGEVEVSYGSYEFSADVEMPGLDSLNSISSALDSLDSISFDYAQTGQDYVGRREWRYSEDSFEFRNEVFLLDPHVGTGIRIIGASVSKLESSNGELVFLSRSPMTCELVLFDVPSQAWSDVLITLEDGNTCTACVVSGFVSTVYFASDFASPILLHHPSDDPPENEYRFAEFLARLRSGLLSEDEIIDTAAYLREGKHRVITLGCIAAQFYDAIRDVDSLRQMASFYAQHGQPLPLDVVLFGGGTISEESGRLYATVPAVDKRSPRTPDERRRRFTYKHTPGFDRYPIAGRIPWMRQAWSAIETAVCEDSARSWRDRALGVIEFLQPGEFTMVRPEGYSALSELAGTASPSLSFVGA